MSTITFDFRHHYQRGERREAEQVAYQWDLGHVAEIFVPLDATYNISYCFSDYDKTDDYAVESITAADDGGYKLTAHVPNKYFERSGELRVYIIGEADDHIITTYEGFLTIRSRLEPDDYVDPDPENGAQSEEAQTHVYSQQSEAWAVGTIDGAPVESTDPQYHNNSKYYAEQAAGSASDASDYATAASGSASDASDYATAASGSASDAHDDAVAAAAVRDAVEAILGVYATVEESTTASRPYKVGEHLILNNVLYRVTVAIAQSGTITPGTNCKQTTVGDEIANSRLWFKNVPVIATTGSIIDLSNSIITPDYVLEGNTITWDDSTKITSLTDWTTETAGHFIVTGTASAATTATFALVKADQRIENS